MRNFVLLLMLVLSACASKSNRPSIIKNAKEASVTITGDRGGGSGFHVIAPSGKTYILTNAHVCKLQKHGKVNVTKNSNNFKMTRDVIAVYKDHDLCLVEAMPDTKGLTVARSAEILDQIMVAGNPGLRPFTVQEGEIISREVVDVVEQVNGSREDCNGKFMEADPLMQMFLGITSLCFQSRDSYRSNVIGYPGNSGSAVLNTTGQVIGVLYAGDTRIITDHMLVPVDFISDFLKKY